MESLLDSIFYLRAKYYLVKIFFNVFFYRQKNSIFAYQYLVVQFCNLLILYF